MANVARYIVEVPLTYDTLRDPLTENDAFEIQVLIHTAIRERFLKLKREEPELLESLYIDRAQYITVSDDNK